MSHLRIGRGLAVALAMAVMALTVAACDSDSDAAVVTTEAVMVSSDDAQVSEATPADPVGQEVVAPAAAEPGEQLAAELAALPVTELSEQETADILMMREEEKLARDVYLTLGDLWGVRVFGNIARAEETHMASMLELIDRYGLEDPVGENGIGVFTNPDMQALYDSLVDQGSQSLTDALIVGATIEDLDIADLQAAIAATDNEDIALVYDSLELGSRNHMRSFVRQLDKNDIEFEPTYISQQEYEAIISSPAEQGNA